MATRRGVPLFPLNTVLFPGMSLPLHIFEERYRLMIGRCIDRGLEFGVVLVRSGREVGDPSAEPCEVGTLARITDVTRMPDGRMNILTEGTERFRILGLSYDEPYLSGDVDTLDEFPGEVLAGTRQAAEAAFEQYIRLLLALAGQWRRQVDLPEGADELSYSIAEALKIEMEQKQLLLEAPRAEERLLMETEILDQELARLSRLVAHKWQNPGGTGFPVNDR